MGGGRRLGGCPTPRERNSTGGVRLRSSAEGRADRSPGRQSVGGEGWLLAGLCGMGVMGAMPWMACENCQYKASTYVFKNTHTHVFASSACTTLMFDTTVQP
jgi:hypothetical protein